MEADEGARGTVYPYCKGCKQNVKIVLEAKRADAHAETPSGTSAKCQLRACARA